MRIALQSTTTGHHGGLPRFFQLLATAFEGAQIEVVSVNEAPELLYAPSISFERPPATALPLICTFHDAHWKHYDTFGADGTDVLEAIGQAWMERATLVCCSSQAMRRELAGHYPGLAWKLRVVPLPPLLDRRAAEHIALRRLRRDRELPERFAFVPAQAGAHKNHIRLFSAWALLKARGRVAPPALVLSGMQTDSFHRPGGPLELLGLQRREEVLGLGYVADDEVGALYEGADLLVMPTRYEAGSFPVMEAMARSVPVVASAIPPVVEQMRRQGVWARCFDPDDPVEIARAVESVLLDPERAHRLAVHSRVAIASQSWDSTGRGYRQVFEEALARHRPLAHRRAPGHDALRVAVTAAGVDTPGARRWTAAARALLAAAARRWRRTLLVVEAVGDPAGPPELVASFAPVPRLRGLPRLAGPAGDADGAFATLAFVGGPRDAIVMPRPFQPTGATARARLWTRERYALPERFVLVPGGAAVAHDRLPTLVAALWSAGEHDPVVICGDGTEALTFDEGVVIGLGRVDDRELLALYALARAVAVPPAGPLGLTLAEAVVSGRPLLGGAAGAGDLHAAPSVDRDPVEALCDLWTPVAKAA